jgi:hypothetical protein
MAACGRRQAALVAGLAEQAAGHRLQHADRAHAARAEGEEGVEDVQRRGGQSAADDGDEGMDPGPVM